MADRCVSRTGSARLAGVLPRRRLDSTGSGCITYGIPPHRSVFAARADPKVVQRVLGHATASMTMDLYGYLMDANLWEAARAIGASWGHLRRPNNRTRTATMRELTKVPGRRGVWVEPPIGIEPMTYALREACRRVAHALAALIARTLALMALAELGLSGDPVTPRPLRPAILLLCVTLPRALYPRREPTRPSWGRWFTDRCHIWPGLRICG